MLLMEGQCVIVKQGNAPRTGVRVERLISHAQQNATLTVSVLTNRLTKRTPTLIYFVL